MRLLRYLFVSSLLLTVLLPSGLKAQALTQETIKRIINNQPDYAGDYLIVRGGETVKLRLIKKGESFRHEIMPLQNAASQISEQYRSYKIITLNIPGKPILALDPQEGTYTELPDNFRFPTPDTAGYFQAALRSAGTVSCREMGTETIDGHKAKRIKISFGSADEGTIYVADELKGLIVKMEAKDSGGPMSFTMSNVSLDVPQSLFEVPPGYKKVDFDSFLAAIKQKIVK